MRTSFCRYNGAETQDQTIFGMFSAFVYVSATVLNVQPVNEVEYFNT